MRYWRLAQSFYDQLSIKLFAQWWSEEPREINRIRRNASSKCNSGKVLGHTLKTEINSLLEENSNFMLMLLKSFQKSHVLRFGLVQFIILLTIFLLEIAQMNINKWGDSWGSGCIVAAVGYCLFIHWYAINRHQEKIDKGEIKPNQYTSSNQFGWMSKLACVFTGILFVAVLAYQLGNGCHRP